MPDPFPSPPPLPRLQPRPLWREMMDEHEELEEGDQIGNQSIGGWLVLFGLGRVLAPVFLGVALWKDTMVFINPQVWTAFTTPGSDYYQPIWSTLFIYEISGNTLLFLFSVALLWLFFARWRAFPPLMIAYMVVLTLFSWGDFFLTRQMHGLGTKTVQQGPAAFGQTLTALIWIPYFLVSVRVRRTFVK